jgi:3-hydroxyacyl-[acyl-carrier-protein] dehydratase
MNVVLNCDEIRIMLPHRYPFLMLDYVAHLVAGSEAVGVKNVTVNEPYFQGHFPKQSIMPGVMIVESLAQLTAIVYCSKILNQSGITDFKQLHSLAPGEIASHVGYLVEIDVKFKKPVIPGDQLILKVILGKSFGKLTQVMVSAKVKETIAAQGKLIVSEKE